MDSAILAALPLAVSGTITAQDMDVYQVTTTADVLSVTLRFDHAQGDLDWHMTQPVDLLTAARAPRTKSASMSLWVGEPTLLWSTATKMPPAHTRFLQRSDGSRPMPRWERCCGMEIGGLAWCSA